MEGAVTVWGFSLGHTEESEMDRSTGGGVPDPVLVPACQGLRGHPALTHTWHHIGGRRRDSHLRDSYGRRQETVATQLLGTCLGLPPAGHGTLAKL